MRDGSYREWDVRLLVTGWLAALRRRADDGPAWRCRTWDAPGRHQELRREVLAPFDAARCAPRSAPAKDAAP